MLCAKFGWNWPSSSGEEDENVKSLWRRTTDKFWSEKVTWAFGSGELKSVCVRGEGGRGEATQVFGLMGQK